MTPVLTAILGVLAGFALAAVVLLWFHERREFKKQDRHEELAQERERRAMERHDKQMKALNDNNAMTLQAVNQRNRHELRLRALESAANDHANHLEQLGRLAPVRVVGEP